MIRLLKKIYYYKLFRPSYFKKILFDNYKIVGKIPEKEKALENVFTWIRISFEVNKDGGSSAYYRFGTGWKASYPETTGYLIPTLYDYAEFTNDNQWRLTAKKAADWLISIQYPEGGWQGLQVDERCDARIFNSGMILDGLIAAFRYENDKKYLEAAIKGLDWIMGKMDEDGMFTKSNVNDGGSYDTLVLACLLMVTQFVDSSKKSSYNTKIQNSLDKHLSLQTENGWFKKCNFSDSYKDTALLHHIGYTLDGLIISSSLLNNDKYYHAAKKTADQLLSKFESDSYLYAFNKPDWSTYYDINDKKATICLTGCSQVAIVFQKIAQKENDLRYRKAAEKINDFAASVSNLKYKNEGLDHGLPGSFPINGNYQPYQIVNWAAKYHAESLLLSLNRCMPKKHEPVK